MTLPPMARERERKKKECHGTNVYKVRNPSYIAYKPISHSYIPEKQTTL
jgi:hypothetical protein